MKKSYIVMAVAFVAVLIFSTIGYNLLKDNYEPNEVIRPTSSATADRFKMPDFTVVDSNNNDAAMSSKLDKPLVINFWATWCGPCKSELPAFENAYKTYGDKVNFMMVNLTDGSRETVEGVKSFVADNGFTFPVYYDVTSSATNACSIYSIPTTFFVGTDGNMVDIRLGAMSETILMDSIKSLIGGTAIEGSL